MTPFRPDTFAVDHDSLRRNIERWIDAGVPTILLTYGTSEFAVLSEREIAAVTETTVRATDKRAMVVACTGRWWLGQAIEFAHYCETLGAGALMVVQPESVGWDKLNDLDRIVEFHRQIQSQTRIPLVYHSWYNEPRMIDAAQRVCELEHVVGLKQEFDNYALYQEMGLRLGDKAALICGAGGSLAYWAYQWGFRGSLSGVAQWAPKLELRGVRAMIEGDLIAARKHLDLITPFRRAAAGVGNHAAIKHAMDRAGLAGGPLRPPQKNLTDEQKRRLDAEIDKLLETERSV